MIPYDYQVKIAEQALEIIRENGLVYFAMEERTGKTLSFLLMAELSAAKRVLVVTKKKAEAGIAEALANWEHDTYFRLTTYTQVHKIPVTNFDLVILDESHNYISSFPKVGTIHKALQKYCAGKPIAYSSATPHAQSYSQLYHQFSLCAWSPWAKFKNFYHWFEKYGKPYNIEIQGINRPQYDKTHVDKVQADVSKLFITKTREELGFEQEPEDVLHYIEPSDNLKKVYNILLDQKIIQLSVGKLVCDSVSKLRTSLHQLEGGTIKIDNSYHLLSNSEKIDYILNKWGDNEDLVIMYNFKAELVKLETRFKKALILQATSYAEGVDLHKYNNLVIYSQDYSTARHNQRRARQANIKRKTPIKVHFLLMVKGISSQVYKTVSLNKRNYIDSLFNKDYL